MECKVEAYDYSEAIKAVQILLDKIFCNCERGNTDLDNVPSAVEIVDLVIDKII